VTTYIFGNPVWQLGVSNNKLVGQVKLLINPIKEFRELLN
jgi:hypothetical protein